MNFTKWYEDYEESFHDALLSYSKTQGLEIKGHSCLIPTGLDTKVLHLYNAYRTERTTKRLVWATWFLAIATIILATISLFLR